MKPIVDLNELTTIIANEIREKGLNEIIPLENIRKKVTEKISLIEQPEQLEELENLSVKNSSPNLFPYVDDLAGTTGTTLPPETVKAPSVGFESGEEPTPLERTPEIGYVPELPLTLQNVPPGKIIVFDINELSIGGENLSNKPFALLDDPDIKKSMQDMWIENGKQKADVYLADFKKAGEIEFDYVRGTAKFIEQRYDTKQEEVNTYHENPYSEKVTPQIARDETIKKQIETSVDIEKIVHDIVSNILKDYFSKNNNQPIESDINIPNNEIEPITESSISLASLTEINSIYKKIDTPEEIKKAIIGKESKAKKITENKEVKGWEYNNQEFYLPTDPISIRKCYIKKS